MFQHVHFDTIQEGLLFFFDFLSHHGREAKPCMSGMKTTAFLLADYGALRSPTLRAQAVMSEHLLTELARTNSSSTPSAPETKGSSAEFVGKTVFHRRLRRPRCSPSLKASLASSAAAPALTLGCAPRCRLVWAMGNGASGGGSGHRV